MKLNILKVATHTLIILTLALGIAYAGSYSTSSAEQEAEARVNIGDIGSNNEGKEPKRYFAPPGEVVYPGAPNFFQQQPDETYQTKMKVKDHLEYDGGIGLGGGLTTQAQMNILESCGWLDDRRIMVRSRIKASEVKDEDRLPLDVAMPIIDKKLEMQVRKIATITVLSDSKGSISDDVFAEAQVQAWKLGGQIMHLKAEGFQRVVRNEGTGIGFTWSGSVISGGEMTSTTGVMGAGKTWGEAGLYDHPFIIINVLVVVD